MQYSLMDGQDLEKVPINLSEALETHRIELPTDLCIKISQHTKPPTRDLIKGDGDILLANFLDTGISILGVLEGRKNEVLDITEFIIKPKEHLVFDRWDYGLEKYITLTLKVKLPTGQIIEILDRKKIAMPSRSMNLFFFC